MAFVLREPISIVLRGIDYERLNANGLENSGSMESMGESSARRLGSVVDLKSPEKSSR
jgi:hypothetical protein